MTRIRDLHEQWLSKHEYRAEYEALAPEFELAQTLIEARTKAGLTQEELADAMKTTQSSIDEDVEAVCTSNWNTS